MMSRYLHEPETEVGRFGVEQPKFYEVSGEDFFRCLVCGVLYDEGSGNVCAMKLLRKFEEHLGRISR